MSRSPGRCRATPPIRIQSNREVVRVRAGPFGAPGPRTNGDPHGRVVPRTSGRSRSGPCHAGICQTHRVRAARGNRMRHRDPLRARSRSRSSPVCRLESRCPPLSAFAAGGPHRLPTTQVPASAREPDRADRTGRHAPGRVDDPGLGGTVTHRMRSVDGLIVQVPAGAISGLAAIPGVESVTADRRVTLTSSGPDGTDADALGSLSTVASSIGADSFWRAGFLGKGIDVAVIDSGVATVEGLDTPREGHSRPGPLASSRNRRTSPTSTPTATARTWPGSSRATTRQPG